MDEPRPDAGGLPAEEPEPSPEAPPTPQPTSKRRLIALAALIVGLLVVAHATGVTESVTVESLRDTVQRAGAWGYLLLIVIFALGELVHIPGLVFVFAGVVAYGQLVGGILGYVGAVGSVTFSFVVVRTVGGQALEAIEKPWVRKILDGLEARPIRTVVLIRLVMWMAPPVNYALALSGIKLRDYVIGSMVGLAPVIAVFAIFFEQLMERFL